MILFVTLKETYTDFLLRRYFPCNANVRSTKDLYSRNPFYYINP